MKQHRVRNGFTLVELAIVVATMAILAAVVIVGYNGVQDRAKKSTLSSYLSGVVKEATVYKGRNGAYPTSIASCPTPAAGSLCLPAPAGATVIYDKFTAQGTELFSATASLGTVWMGAGPEGVVADGGMNMYNGTNAQQTGANEFLRYADLAPLIDQIGLVKLRISFDIKSASIANRATMTVYMQDSGGSKYSIGSPTVPVTTSYVRRSVTVTPTVANGSLTASSLAFFGTYGTGNVPSVQNLSVERVP